VAVSKFERNSAFVVAAVCGALILSAYGNLSGSSANETSSSSSRSSEAAHEATSYKLTRYEIDTKQEFDSFIAAFEEAVPPFDPATILAGVTSWDDVVNNTAEAAPNGFLIYSRLPGGTLYKINGVGSDNLNSVSYLVGNHVIAETMYRHYPGATLNAPLRLMIFENEQGNAVFAIDRPSDQFGSFGNKDIAKVGRLLNEKVAGLMSLLNVPVPAGLLR